MAIITRRYRWDGPDLTALRDETDPNAEVEEPSYAVYVDITFDDTVADTSAIDSAVESDGLVPDSSTEAQEATPFLGLRSGGILQNILRFTPTDYVDGLALSFASVSSVQIGTGRARSSDDNFTMVLGSAATVSLASSGANGLDTGSEAANTWYHVYLIADSSGTNAAAGLFSTSSTSPTMPTGYDKRRRIGVVRNNGSSDIVEFIQEGVGTHRIYNYLTARSTRQILTNGTATSRTNVSAATLVPPTTRFGRFEFDTDTIAADFFAGSAGSDIRALPGAGHAFDLMPTDSSQNVAYQNAAILGGTSIWVTGFDEDI